MTKVESRHDDFLLGPQPEFLCSFRLCQDLQEKSQSKRTWCVSNISLIKPRYWPILTCVMIQISDMLRHWTPNTVGYIYKQRQGILLVYCGAEGQWSQIFFWPLIHSHTALWWEAWGGQRMSSHSALGQTACCLSAPWLSPSLSPSQAAVCGKPSSVVGS